MNDPFQYNCLDDQWHSHPFASEFSGGSISEESNHILNEQATSFDDIFHKNEGSSANSETGCLDSNAYMQILPNNATFSGMLPHMAHEEITMSGWNNQDASSSQSRDASMHPIPDSPTRRPSKKLKMKETDEGQTMNFSSGRTQETMRETRRRDLIASISNAGWFNSASSQDRAAIVKKMLPLWKFPLTPLGHLQATTQAVESITPDYARLLLDPDQQSNWALIEHIAYETRPRLRTDQIERAWYLKRALLSSFVIKEAKADELILAALKYEGMSKASIQDTVEHIIGKMKWPKRFEEEQINLFKSLQKRP